MITISEQPNRISPANLPMVINISDTLEATLFYRVTVYQSNDNLIGKLKIFKIADNDNLVNINRLVDNFITTKLGTNTMIESLDGALKYYFTITSYSDSGLLLETYTSEVKWAYNAGRNYIKYDVTDWYMNYSNIANKYADFLTTKPLVNKIFKFQKEFLYFLADELSDVNRFKITFYDYSGNIIKTHTQSIVILNHIIHKINVNPSFLIESIEGITNMSKYTVALYHNNDRVSKERTYIIDKEFDCVEPVCLNWENFEGGIDSFTFINPRETKSADKQTIQKGYIEYSNGRYSPYNSVISNKIESTYKLTSLGVNDGEYRTLSNIIGSLNVYVWVDNNDILPIIISNTSSNIKRRKYSSELLRYTVDFKSKPNLNLIIKYIN